jgi:hypothetical protein
MSNKATMRIGAGADAIKRADRRVGKSIGRESQAQRGAELEFVRTAGPRGIAEMLARLEARGEIVANNDVTADENDFDLDGTADVELDLQNEDLAPVEVWQQPGNLVENAVELGSNADPPEPCGDDDRFELIVSEGVCRFQNPEWAWTFNPVTQRAENQLAEIAARCRVFRALAEWLNRARPSFLKSRDFWHLGPSSLEEADGNCSVLQKDLLSMLDLNRPIREETFSRFIRQCELAWPDGSAPVQILFSKEARLAWVAEAVVLFARNFPNVPLSDRLDKYRNTKTRKGHGGSRAQGAARRGGKTFEEFIREANEKAGTSWEDVLNQYDTRMLKENDHGKKD